MLFSFKFKAYVFCINAQIGQEEHDKSYKWDEPNYRTPETDSWNLWGLIQPMLRTIDVTEVNIASTLLRAWSVIIESILILYI